jgi:hypothetical protein
MQVPLRQSSGEQTSPFYVPGFLDFLGGLVERHRHLWLSLARLETSVLSERLRAVAIRMPIYISGLARAGSTLLHELIASHASVATHRLKDYPMIFTPYWWRRASARLSTQPPRERPHGDRILINAESADALEELLWMAFFPRCHDPETSNIMGAAERQPAFESFYDAHLRKLLLAERATRYAAKANYHVARLAYLVRLLPDARFLVAIRSPASHVLSLVRQQVRFARGQRAHPRALALMRRSGHFEFGLDRRPLNLGDRRRVHAIVEAWERGDDVRGFARQWDQVYGYLDDLLRRDAQVRAATQVVRYEVLCESPAETLRAVLRHCNLPDADAIIRQMTPAISQPCYYAETLTHTDLGVIREETEETAARWGYSTHPSVRRVSSP